MNWGYKILFVYLTFVAGILFLVYKATNESFDLVETNYYEAELKYQNRIDERNRTGALSEAVKVTVTDHRLHVQFPKDFDGKQITGAALIYYPADARKDVNIPFTVSNGVLVLDLPAANQGMHELKLSWKVEQLSYYHEEKLFL